MFEIVEPSAILKRFIKNYCIVELSDSEEYLPANRVFPTGNINLVFHYGSPSKFRQRDSYEYIEPSLVICGQQTSYYDISLSGSTGMIIVVFRPNGAKSFFDFPVSELSNHNLSLHDLLINKASELEERLFSSAGSSERIGHIENFLVNRLIYDRDFERVEHAVKLAERSRGQVRTEYLAKEVCLGVKQFERIFLKHTGLNPKKFVNIVRFGNVLQMKRRFPDADMLYLAIENGYYDQSHFIHDCKRITGQAPRDFFGDKG